LVLGRTDGTCTELSYRTYYVVFKLIVVFNPFNIGLEFYKYLAKYLKIIFYKNES